MGAPLVALQLPLSKLLVVAPAAAAVHHWESALAAASGSAAPVGGLQLQLNGPAAVNRKSVVSKKYYCSLRATAVQP